MHGEGEVHRRRAFGQLEQRALGGEGEDAILIDRHARVFEQFFGIVAGIDDLDQIAQPGDLSIRSIALLVGPVRGKAEFVDPMHLARTDLHFDAHRFAVDQRGVERTIAIVLGRRDVVLELARQELPRRVQHAQRAVAVGHILADDAEGHDVGHLFEGHMAFGHLAPDRIGMLLAA